METVLQIYEEITWHLLSYQQVRWTSSLLLMNNPRRIASNAQLLLWLFQSLQGCRIFPLFPKWNSRTQTQLDSAHRAFGYTQFLYCYPSIHQSQLLLTIASLANGYLFPLCLSMFAAILQHHGTLRVKSRQVFILHHNIHVHRYLSIGTKWV